VPCTQRVSSRGKVYIFLKNDIPAGEKENNIQS